MLFDQYIDRAGQICLVIPLLSFHSAVTKQQQLKTPQNYFVKKRQLYLKI